jgi:DNA-binding IclR family transcriptional regulator
VYGEFTNTNSCQMDTKSEIRVLSLFEAFAELKRPLTLTELSESLGIPASSCFNLVRGIEHRGYLYAARARGALYPTRRLFDVARAIFASDVVSPAVRARMETLRDDVEETTCLAHRRGKEVVYLEVHESPHSIRFSVKVGETRDLHSNSMGKAILASMPPDERGQLLKTLSYRKHSPRTISTAAALERDIEAGRKRGWYSNFGETAADALAAAVPVRIGGETYGLGFVGPHYRVEPHLDRYVKALARAAADISALPTS